MESRNSAHPQRTRQCTRPRGLIPFLVAALLAVGAGGALGAPSQPASGAEADRAFWTSDPALDERLEDVGRDRVLQDVRADLEGFLQRLRRDPSPVSEEERSGFVRTLRWTAILDDQGSLAPLDALAAVERGGRAKASHHYLTYMARWAAWRIRMGDQAVEGKVGALLELWAKENETAQVFAEDRLLELGTAALPHLLDHARARVLPLLDEVPEEALTLGDLEPTRRFLDFTALLAAMVESDKDRTLFEKLQTDPDPRMRRLAQEVLAALEPEP